MVGVAGFEPATPASRTRCSTRLSYTPTRRRAYRSPPKPPQAKPPQAAGGSARRGARARVASGRAMGYPSRLPRRGPWLRHPGGWCNGNTAVFGTVVLGSSPSPPARSPQADGRTRKRIRRRLRAASTAQAGWRGRGLIPDHPALQFPSKVAARRLPSKWGCPRAETVCTCSPQQRQNAAASKAFGEWRTICFSCMDAN